MYRAIVLPVVLYGRETWRFIIMKEHRVISGSGRGTILGLKEGK